MNLIAIFHAEELGAGELEDVLGRHFGGSAQLSATEVVYPNAGGNFSLRITYDGPRIVAIHAGPQLTENDVAAIAQKIETDVLTSGECVAQAIFFAPKPVTGFFRYKDRFQIVPAPDNAPRPPFVMAAHPLVIQFRFRHSPDGLVRHVRRMRGARELALLLSGLLTWNIDEVGPMARHHWVVTSTEDPQNPEIQYRQEMYFVPGLDAELPDFSDPASLTPMTLIPTDKYYNTRGISATDVLDIPDCFETLCDEYFALSREDRAQFLRSCFWFQYAHRVHNYSRSAYLTSMVSAVEALMPSVSGKVPVCATCGRATGKGSTARFVEFVEHHAPGVPQDARKKLYYVRSALLHGGKLLPSDEMAWLSGLTGATLAEYDDLQTAWAVVRAVLVNWLARPTLRSTP